MQCIQQSLLVDKWQESYALPCHFFAIHVDQKLGRVEIKDLRLWVGHEPLERLWQVVLACCG